jgi:hypothetical protein
MHNMATELRCALDPVAFAETRLEFAPDRWQAKVLHSTGNLLLNCSRQAGKSTTTAILATHTALYSPGALVLLGSPSLRQSRELFSKVSDFIGKLEPGPTLEEDNKLSLTLTNGSRVVSLPGSGETVRGFSAPDLILEDEAAFVEDSFYTAVRPMLAVSGGRLILLTTPHGKRGHFYQAWTQGGDEWTRIEVPAQDCPRISPEFLEAEKQALGEWGFRQEYLCEFLETHDQVFRQRDIERAFSKDVKPLFPADADNSPSPFFQEN